MRKILILSLLALAACKDDVQPSVSLISPYLDESKNLVRNTRSNDITWELGLVFSSSVAGSVKELGTNMPSAGKYWISLWDHSSKERLAAVEIDQNTGLSLADIPELKLEAGKKYVLSVLARDLNTGKRTNYWVINSNAGSSENFLPATQGTFTFHEACYTQNSISQPLFPGTVTGVRNELYGLPELRFIAD